MLISSEVIKQSGVEFGTSGARGLVEQFKPDVCTAFTVAFLATLEAENSFKSIAIGIDNRPSSYKMAQACASAAKKLNITPIYVGVLPTPAIACYALKNGIPAIMVTGSHIPFDRNGLKFYKPDGEITKVDEKRICEIDVDFEIVPHESSYESNYELRLCDEAVEDYVNRFIHLFPNDWLHNKRIGIYEHSSAGRDIYNQVFQKLGATVVSLGRSDEFIPIDTEAVSEADQNLAKKWSQLHKLDMIFSTDGDGDRPLIADETGSWLRGDLLGLVCAKQLNANGLATPINCNTAIELSNYFDQIERTKIGSPYVIESLKKLDEIHKTVVGFEANGGFIQGSDVCLNGQKISALPTRDALLPALMLLKAAGSKPISNVIDSIPARFTHSYRIRCFSRNLSLNLINDLLETPAKLVVLTGLDDTSVLNLDTTDGLRFTLCSSDIIHIRPSGNAPELRCYAESGSLEKAIQLVSNVISNINFHYNPKDKTC